MSAGKAAAGGFLCGLLVEFRNGDSDDVDTGADAVTAEAGSGEGSSAPELAPVPPRVLRSIGMILLL